MSIAIWRDVQETVTVFLAVHLPSLELWFFDLRKFHCRTSYACHTHYKAEIHNCCFGLGEEVQLLRETRRDEVGLVANKDFAPRHTPVIGDVHIVTSIRPAREQRTFLHECVRCLDTIRAVKTTWLAYFLIISFALPSFSNPT